MMEQIETQDFMNGLAFKVDEILTALNTYFEGFDNTRIITLVLLLLAIALFFFSVVVVSIRHIISIIKSNNPAKNIKKEERNSIENIFGFEDDEDELEKELQRELELAATEQHMQEMEEQRQAEQAEKERIERENF